MKTIDTKDFDIITLKLASPERILEWSYGEVTKPETINYRTGRSERGGLFDEKIFGPEKDYECYCGKYRRIRYKDIICEKCGVEVTKSIVRRERMGHIELATPVAHVWFLRGVPSRMALLADIPMGDLERVVYFAGYIITTVHQAEKERIMRDIESEYKAKVKSTNDEETKEKLKDALLAAKKELADIALGKVLGELEYHHFSVRFGTAFEASIGAEAIYQLFKNLDLSKLEAETVALLEKASSLSREKYQRRLSLIRSMLNSGIRPEWMFLTRIPVIPPALRPMVALGGGRHATSDVNDLYRRVINRNTRLKKLKEIGAPDVILRNEKRILQEAVDTLIDNSSSRQKDAQAVNQSQKRALKSLSDTLKSKQGLFRQNLLGKRVDYSGRSVIVVGPDLKISQCGLPKHMALELFRPFVISKLIAQEIAPNVRIANHKIEDGIPEVWAILEEVIAGKFVLLNRAPTLHRLGIQAFNPVLIEGNAIQLHPLVCSAFNADFDGDTMSVYLPLGAKAQEEARTRIASSMNLLKPANGDPVANPSQGIILGCYWMTVMKDGLLGEAMMFGTPNQALTAYDYKAVNLRAKITVLGTEKAKYAKFDGKPFTTTVGRILFNTILPDDFPFVNDELTKKRVSALVDDLIMHYGIAATAPILDSIKNLGFKFATLSGATFGMESVIVPEGKTAIVEAGRKEEAKIIAEYNEGLLSDDERYEKVVALWESVKNQIKELMPEALKRGGAIYDMVTSGARGSVDQATQMAGMTGLIQSPSGKIIDFPVIPSYKEGLSSIEYFITTHGARKGQADTALKTADAGYMTRKLVVVAQDVVVTEEDCATKEGKTLRAENVSGIIIPLAKHIRGRVLAKDVKDEAGTVLFKRGVLLTKEDAKVIEHAGVTEVSVRTPMTCKARHGVCRACYGLDLARNGLVECGEAVGVVAAQAIGEPGTQLTLRTFHSGGVAGSDITQGLPRVIEIFERRIPKIPAVVAHADGEVVSVTKNGAEATIKVLGDGSDKKHMEIEYTVPARRIATVAVGARIKKGDILTDGSADISEIFKFGGKEKAEDYIVHEINKVYELQGASIARKHIEIIIRQMFSKCIIKDAGDSKFSIGDVIESRLLDAENILVDERGGKAAIAEPIVLGISNISLGAESFLAAASFQNTNKILIDNAVRGGSDPLRGLMENVIVGRLIPAGTGFVPEKEEVKE